MKKAPDTPAAPERLASISPKNFAVPRIASEIGLAVLSEFEVPDDSRLYSEPNTKGLFLRLQSAERDERLVVMNAKQTPPERNVIDLNNPDAVTPKQWERLRSLVQAQDVTESGLLSPSRLSEFFFDSEKVREPEQDRQIYAGLIGRGDLVVWGGEKKHRKSNVILEFGISMATGRDFLGFRFLAAKPQSVLMIDYESNDGSLNERHQGIVDAMKLDEREQAQLRANLNIIEVKEMHRAGLSLPLFQVPGKNKTNRDDANYWRELVANHPADVYVIDPLRHFHGAEENDAATIAELITEIRRVFKGSTVILAHHMRKPNEFSCHLSEDMRKFSDGLRGSSALTAHADVVVLQERMQKAGGDEEVYLGAFMRDGADIEPFPIVETDYKSFYFETTTDVPPNVRDAFDALKDKLPIKKSQALTAIRKANLVARATAYRHLNELLRLRLVTENAGGSISANEAPSETK